MNSLIKKYNPNPKDKVAFNVMMQTTVTNTSLVNLTINDMSKDGIREIGLERIAKDLL